MRKHQVAEWGAFYAGSAALATPYCIRGETFFVFLLFRQLRCAPACSPAGLCHLYGEIFP